MTPGRRRALTAFFLFVIAGHAFDIVAKREDWPFSYYPMYAVVRPSHLKKDLVVGVSAEGEFPINVGRHFKPLDVTRLRRGLGKIEQQRPADYRRALNQLFERYDQLRARGVHRSPPLLALRIYKAEWTLRDRASNRDQPDAKHLHVFAQHITADLQRDIESQRRGTPATPSVPAQGDIVVSVADGTFVGSDVERVADRAASIGAVALLRGHSDDRKVAESYVEIAVAAAPGTYHVWLRGSGGSIGEDSVWLRPRKGRLKCWSSDVAMGNFVDVFPPRIFGWSGTAPGAPACTLTLEENATLRLWAHRGPVKVDQVWLSRAQVTPPRRAVAMQRSVTP